MPVHFKYQARNPSGRTVSGRIAAPHKFAAIHLLRQQRLFVTDITEISVKDQGLLKCLPARKVSLKELSLFCRQFATLTAAGIPVVQSLSILLEQAENKSLQQAIRDVIRNLESGKSLSQSMSFHPGIFSPVFIHMVEAGEISGSLDHILGRLANHFENYYDLTEKCKSAITYPLFIVFLAVVAVGVILVFVLPAFTQIIMDLQAPVPIPTAVVMKSSELIRNFWYVLLPAGLLPAMAYKTFTSTGSGKKTRDEVALKLPVYGPLMRKINIVRVCRTLAVLLSSGIPLLPSLHVLKSNALNIVFNRAIEGAETSLREGNGLAPPLGQSGVFPPMVVRMIRVGEETGELEVLLNKIADYYEKEVYQTITRLAALLEPILICLVGGVVSLIMISILMPVFSIMNALQ